MRWLWALAPALAVPASLGVGGAAAQGPAPPADRVLVVSLPTLTWERVVQERPPVLVELLRQSAVASLSVRTIGPTTSLGEAYATIGAGNRTSVAEDVAGLALPPAAPYEGDEAARVFQRRCGCMAGDASVLQLGAPQIARLNDRLLYGSEPGSLGTALARAGRRAAVVANADRALSGAAGAVHREAALAVMDGSGRVAAGEVGPRLLAEDPAEPFGLRTDVAAAAAAFADAWDRADVVLLEVSDLDRVDAYADVATSEAKVAAGGRALARADELLARVLERVDLERDLVLVVAPTAPRDGPPQLTVAGIAGPGFEPGRATSATTRRAGYLTLPDVAPTVLDALGLEVPSAVTGALASSLGGGPPDARSMGRLADINETTVFRDRATGPVTVAFIALQVLTYAVGVAALTRLPALRSWAHVLALVALAVPTLAFLSALVPYADLGIAGYLVALFAAATALAGAALALATGLRRRTGAAGPLVAPLALVGLALAVLLGDVALLGGRMQIDTVFGYSPTVAGRFAGYGNLAFAMVAASALVVVTGAWGVTALVERRPAPTARRPALGLVAVVLVGVVVVDGHPSLGSDVGGVLALVPAFAVVGLTLSGARIGLRRGLVIGGGTVAVLALFAAVDLARSPESRTHLGRLVAGAFDSGSSGVITVIARKASANASILTSSIWTLVISVALGSVAFLLWRRQGIFGEVAGRVPGLRVCLVGALVAGGLGFALNDSGVAVPAMMLAVLLPYLTAVAVRAAPTSGT
ncbi:MAG: hypothetical protein ACRDZ9_00330 [Acidimicrobiales bacterium]